MTSYDVASVFTDQRVRVYVRLMTWRTCFTWPYYEDKIKWRTRPEEGDDLSSLVHGVDIRQPGEKFY
jgi:hypothetical protein